MATTFTWNVSQLDRELTDGFVYCAYYQVSAESDQLDAEGNPYTAGAYGSVGFQRPDNLLDYDSLTKDQVIEWVKTALGGDEKIAAIEAQLQANIDERITPSKGQGVPWQ